MNPLYENDEQRTHIHISWQKVEAIDETYWRCRGCMLTADKPILPQPINKETKDE